LDELHVLHLRRGLDGRLYDGLRLDHRLHDGLDRLDDGLDDGLDRLDDRLRLQQAAGAAGPACLFLSVGRWVWGEAAYAVHLGELRGLVSGGFWEDGGQRTRPWPQLGMDEMPHIMLQAPFRDDWAWGQGAAAASETRAGMK
jgi:hypothetical protein